MGVGLARRHDVNDKVADIEGQISGTPGTTIDGSMSFDLKSPAMKLDVDLASRPQRADHPAARLRHVLG